ncbi:MAG: hypothetical protein EA397_05555 [Deltaproteobacteria bacterium]|nr:MAG: hypothetical protein EA397_05555 [Deltaproteobacteria bacterium]
MKSQRNQKESNNQDNSYVSSGLEWAGEQWNSFREWVENPFGQEEELPLPHLPSDDYRQTLAKHIESEYKADGMTRTVIANLRTIDDSNQGILFASLGSKFTQDYYDQLFTPQLYSIALEYLEMYWARHVAGRDAAWVDGLAAGTEPLFLQRDFLPAPFFREQTRIDVGAMDVSVTASSTEKLSTGATVFRYDIEGSLSIKPLRASFLALSTFKSGVLFLQKADKEAPSFPYVEGLSTNPFTFV